MFSNFFVGDEVMNLHPHLATDDIVIPMYASGTVVHTEGINAVVAWSLEDGTRVNTRTSFTRITRDTRVRYR